MSFLSLLFGAPPRVNTGGLAGTRTRAAPPVAVVNGRRAVRVPRNTRPLYEERGWRRNGSKLSGYFRTRSGSTQGRIEDPDGPKPEYFIIDPPPALLRGPHGACFQQRDKHTFYIHWNRRPSDVNAGILRIEQYLIEAQS